MVLLEFAMAPHGRGESLSADVARILDVIDRSGVPYQLTPMGTILEGEWDEVMAVVTACFKTLQTDCPRIGVNLKVDYRAGPRQPAAQQDRQGREAPGPQAQDGCRQSNHSDIEAIERATLAAGSLPRRRKKSPAGCCRSIRAPSGAPRVPSRCGMRRRMRRRCAKSKRVTRRGACPPC